MKIASTVKLGHKNVMLHKKSSFVFMIFFGILFGIAVSFALNTIRSKDEIFEKYEDATNGKVMMQISLCDGSYLAESEKTCETPEVYDKIAHKKAEKYHGEVIGAVITYISKNNTETISVVPEKAAKNLKVEPAYYTPDEKIPTIESNGYFNNANHDERFYNLGVFPKEEAEIYLVLDGTNRVQNYILLNGYVVEYYSPLLIFDNKKDAFDFYSQESNAKEIFTENMKTQAEYNEKFTSIKFLFLSFFTIMVIAIIMIFILYFKKDEELLTLYRSLGATKKNIATIYFTAAIEIIICVSIISLIIGNILSLMQ
jgi:hypothetical protein